MAQFVQPPLDLVFGSGYPTNNRWKRSNAVINTGSIRAPADLPTLIGNLRSLRMVKIFELARKPVLELLDALAAIDKQRGNLVHLEIDRLRPIEGTAITYAFVALQMLSIDRVERVNDPQARERPEGPAAETTIQFDAPSLHTVSLGKLLDPSIVTLLSLCYSDVIRLLADHFAHCF